MDNAIRVDNLTKCYRDLLAVDYINFEVRQGEVFGFLGPNGAGKTTTIAMLLGLVRPTAGSAEVLGRDIRRGAAEITGNAARRFAGGKLHFAVPVCTGGVACGAFVAAVLPGEKRIADADERLNCAAPPCVPPRLPEMGRVTRPVFFAETTHCRRR